MTDGIKETRLPRWLAVSTSDQGVLKKNEREWILDGNWVSGIDIKGAHAWVQIEFGGEGAPSADRIDIDGGIQGRPPDDQNWTATLRGSDDGQGVDDVGVGKRHGAPDRRNQGFDALKTAARAADSTGWSSTPVGR